MHILQTYLRTCYNYVVQKFHCQISRARFVDGMYVETKEIVKDYIHFEWCNVMRNCTFVLRE